MFKKIYWLFLLLVLLWGTRGLAAEEINVPTKIHSVAVQRHGENFSFVVKSDDSGHWHMESIIKMASIKGAEKSNVKIVCVLPPKYDGWEIAGVKNIQLFKGIIFSSPTLIRGDKKELDIIQEEITFVLPGGRESLEQFLSQQDSLQLILQKPEK